MPRRGMCQRSNSTCHCEEAAAAADEAIPKLGFGDCFAPLAMTEEVSEQEAVFADEAIPKLGFADCFAEFTLSAVNVLAMTDQAL